MGAAEPERRICALSAAMLCALFEFILGIYLFFGIRRRVAPLLALLMMAFMTPLTLWLAIANPISDCGCFGDAVVLTNWETFFKNIVLLIAAISVFKWRRHIFNLVTTKVDWLISLYSILFIIFFMLFCLRYLPVFDFRPYHVGADIIKGMTIPEGEKLPSMKRFLFIRKTVKNRNLRLIISRQIPRGPLSIRRRG